MLKEQRIQKRWFESTLAVGGRTCELPINIRGSALKASKTPPRVRAADLDWLYEPRRGAKYTLRTILAYANYRFWPVSALFSLKRPPTSQALHLCLLSDLKRVVNLDTEITHGALQLSMPQQ